MGTFSRIRYVIAANTNALLEKAEDPEKLLRALIREMEDAGEDARLAVADLLAEQQHLAREVTQLQKEIAEWQDRAEQAVTMERDDLARAALKAKAELADRLETATNDQDVLAGRVAQLEADMTTLKAKLAEARSRLKELQRPERRRPAPSRQEDHLSRNERKIRQAMGRFDRLQRQVERLEARVRSYEVGGVAPSPWEADATASDPAVEAELEALKAKVVGKKPAKEASKPAQKADKPAQKAEKTTKPETTPEAEQA